MTYFMHSHDATETLQNFKHWHSACIANGMKHMNLNSVGFEHRTKGTRKREFLDEMNVVDPDLCITY